MIRAAVAVALTLTLASGVADSKCQQEGQHRAPSSGHQQPAPVPDPNTPRGSFPGNVAITLYWEHSQAQTVVVFDFGQGKQHRTGKRPAGHWDVVVKPNQQVYAAVVPAHPGEKGRISIYIVQHNNGRKICQDSNDDTEGNGGADCGGLVVI